jgi:hypothetical protein
VRRAAAHLAPALASSTSTGRIERLAGLLPVALDECLCLEAGLGQRTLPIDFGLLCTRRSSGADILAGRSSVDLPDELLASHAWQTVRRFSREWTEPGSAVEAHITDIWIEFEMGRAEPELAPTIFISAGIGRHQPDDVSWLRPVLESLDVPAAGSLLRTLQQYRPLALQNGFHLGVCCAPGTTTARLVFYGVTDDALAWLAGAGVAHIAPLRDIARELRALTDIISIGITLEAAGDCDLTLECKFEETVRIDKARCGRLLDRFEALGCCTPAQRDALLAWPGGSVERLAHRMLPATVLRKISHFELIRRTDATLDAKAYLFSVVV